jgi:hypothetical protein
MQVFQADATDCVTIQLPGGGENIVVHSRQPALSADESGMIMDEECSSLTKVDGCK